MQNMNGRAGVGRCRCSLAAWMWCVVLLGVVVAGCQTPEDVPTAYTLDHVEPESARRFTSMPAAYTGVDFANTVEATQAFNVFTYRNFYNGGGVGLADVNDDGLLDVYLTANQGPNRLYLNRGEFRFEDVTQRAGVAGERAWSTGVSLADVNGDGLIDIYVCNAGNLDGDDQANELFIHEGFGEDGLPRYSEQAARYGLDDRGYSTHAAFFDYDHDGDLDVYVLNNSFRAISSFGLRNIRHERHPFGGDKLYRNDDGRFVDVSEEAGIFGSEIGFGLGVTVGDVNGDGWMDIYVSNDFFERDYLYVNAQDGTFREKLVEAMPTTSLFSMGADVADLDNDARPEIYVTDMLPESDRRLKTTSSYESWDIYQAKLRNDYHHQFMRNALQRNNGDGTFSEVAQLAGVDATDWSWGALMADFDLDGRRDIFVSNGVGKDVTNQDFIDYLANAETQQQAREQGVDYLGLLERIPETKLPNALFHNRGDLAFEDVAEAWGLAAPTFSNGAAYGDLDNDGDLDLVVSNFNDPVHLFRNETRERTEGGYLQVQLQGEAPNTLGVGARVLVRVGEETIYGEQMPIRGFQSSVDPVLTLGVGAVDTVASVLVLWPDGRVEEREAVAVNQRLMVRQADGTPAGHDRLDVPDPADEALFLEVTDVLPDEARHAENAFVDFDREPLVPKMTSTEGPRAAVADVNGDSLEDLFIGGAKEQAGRLLLQRADGSFALASDAPFAADAISEDVAAAFFDADRDGDQDLYVVSGGNEYARAAPALQDRLYLNDGRGAFTKTVLPDMGTSGSTVAPGDYDGDGDLDLFVGGRMVPWSYGLTPRSVLLRNDGGRFTDVTDTVAPGLASVGLVTDARWADVDGDARDDLVVVGEWMPVTVYRNEGGRLRERTAEAGLGTSHGWWNRLLADDLDGDGDVDFVVGNLGLNTRFRATAETPMTLHVKDFDRNGWVEQVVSYPWEDGVSYPLALRRDLLGRLPMLKKRYTDFESYAGQTVDDIFTEEELDEAEVREIRELASVILLNDGQGRFTTQRLPREAQVSPVYGLLARDFDGDGRRDLLLAGNFFGVKPEVGRMAAGFGLMLRGDGHGGFEPVPATESGFSVPGQTRDLASVRHARYGSVVMALRNDDAPKVFRVP